MSLSFPETSSQKKNKHIRRLLSSLGASIGILISPGAYAKDDWQTIVPEKSCKKEAKEFATSEIGTRLGAVMKQVKDQAGEVFRSDAKYHYYPLIVRDPSTGEIRKIELQRERRVIHVPSGKKGSKEKRAVDLWPGNFTSIDSCDFEVSLKPNGLNTPMIVTDTWGKLWDVLGWVGHYRFRDRIKVQAYTPVTQIVTDESLVADGRERLTHYREHTESWLRAKGVKTTFDTSRGLLDITPSGLIETLIIIEKMDPSVYRGDDSKEWEKEMSGQIPRIYGRLGANREVAFVSQVSGAKACGISQYTEKSWNEVQDRIPDLSLGAFEEGCRDHEVSIRAMYGHIEMEMSEFAKRPRVLSWIQNEGQEYLPLILAMGYNSNVTNIARHLDAILASQYTCIDPREVVQRLLPKLPRKLIDEKKPELGYQVSETLFYSIKFLYFQKIAQGKQNDDQAMLYQKITEEIRKQRGSSRKKESPLAKESIV